MQPTPPKPSPALLALANAVPSVLWSALALVPISVYCYQHMARPWLYGGLAGSMLAFGVPRAWLGYWQLSRRAAPYRQLGVALAGRLTQNGDVVNRLIRHRYPAYRHVRSRAGLAALLRQTYYQERFHLGLFLFFLFAGGYAVGQGQAGWAGLITLANVGYNLYPMWLQQYVRVRLAAQGS
ncbi:MAG: hypothetical protein JWP58_1606 [Hymenobacter sp.]|nr:hypothetical protein [Hymenobacter sp.]